jgi:hypothetical protein
MSIQSFYGDTGILLERELLMLEITPSYFSMWDDSKIGSTSLFHNISILLYIEALTYLLL